LTWQVRDLKVPFVLPKFTSDVDAHFKQNKVQVIDLRRVYFKSYPVKDLLIKKTIMPF
jgi:hypothetical protein